MENKYLEFSKPSGNKYLSFAKTEDKGATRKFVEAAIETPWAVAETATTVATGMASTVLGGIAGLSAAGTKYLGFTKSEPADVVRAVQEAGTYLPRSKTAQDMVGAIQYPFEKWHKVAKFAGEKTQDVTGSVSGATAVETAIDFAPWLFLPKAARMAKKIPGVSSVARNVKEYSANVRDVVSPISSGTPQARVAAKTYANSVRASNATLNQVLTQLEKRFSKNDMGIMDRALATEEIAFITGKATNKGLASLPPKQLEAVQAMMLRHKGQAEIAVQEGILGSSRDIYSPRKLASQLGGESALRIKKALKTTTKHAKKRKYLTREETAAAASKKTGHEMQVVEDIRVLPLVTAELERAIAGRRLIAEVESYSKALGVKTVVQGQAEGYFTMDNAAFTRPVPRFELRKTPGAKGGKWKAVKTEDGQVIYDRKPIYVHESFRGPLDAVLNTEVGKITGGFYTLKAKSMSAIMFSPLMHGMVIWGKALPFQPIRTLAFKNYSSGNRLLNNKNYLQKETPFKTHEEFVTHASKAGGLSPIQNMGWMQRMTDIAQTPQLTAGRSLTAKALGNVAKVFGERAKQGTMRAVDAAGHVWHDKLLWEPIRNAQYGMYWNLRQNFIKKGMAEGAADQLAGHMANRFAGSIPFEDMHHGLRAAGNIMLFSRTFNATNIGIYKDAIKGLPRAVQSQILKTGKEIDLKIANSTLRKAAAGTLVKDIVAMYVMNSMLQSAWQYWKTEDLPRVAQDYMDGWERYSDSVAQNPLAAVFDLEELASTAMNEPGKKQRIRIGDDPMGRAIYIRNPVGKIGEDLLKAASDPMQLLFDKLSPTAKFAMALGYNDKSLRRKYNIPIYNETEGWEGIPENLGKIAFWFFEAHTPSDYIGTVKDTLTGDDPTGLSGTKAISQPLGFTWSQGNPKGPIQGMVNEIRSKHDAHKRGYMPRIKKHLKNGRMEEAVDMMLNEADMTPDEMRSLIQDTLAPHLSESSLRSVMKYADEEESKLLEQMIHKEYGK